MPIFRVTPYIVYYIEASSEEEALDIAENKWMESGDEPIPSFDVEETKNDYPDIVIRKRTPKPSLEEWLNLGYWIEGSFLCQLRLIKKVENKLFISTQTSLGYSYADEQEWEEINSIPNPNFSLFVNGREKPEHLGWC